MNDAWMAFATILAIIAIVLLAGGLIAFIGHLIIGAIDKGETKEVVGNNEVIPTNNNQSVQPVEKDEYDFEAINQAKAEEEKAIVENSAFEEDKLFEEDKQEDLEAIENRLKEANNEDDVDLDQLIDEISDDAIEEDKNEENNEIQTESELDNYHIEDILNSLENEDETSEEIEDETFEENEETVQPEVDETVATEPEDEGSNEGDQGEEKEVDLEEEKDVVEEETEEEKDDADAREIESLKAQLAELNKQLEEARSAKVEVVKINMTEEECLARLEILDERLKNAKKEYKTNMKEYRPLKKVMTDLDRYQTKLRRKEAIVAKKKVALYGVNNYVDIDKEKAEKLANELELLDGLRLSVNHCEEVINANKDRYPILEHTNNILEEQIANIEADIETTNATLAAIRGQNGEGENK